MKPRGDLGGSNDRSRELRAIKPPCYAASLYLQTSSDFLLYVKFARKVFTNYFFFLRPDF